MNDADLIKSLGGPVAVCELLGIEKYPGVQRVTNWIKRGIPASVKVQYPEIFMQSILRNLGTNNPVEQPCTDGCRETSSNANV